MPPRAHYGNGKGLMSKRVEANKRNAIAFYDLMFNQNPPHEAMERYGGDRYIQHNPGEVS